MSFKREGNDKSLLQILRKRRINELLSEKIPEDEAKLLSNGRFSCIICPSNPVFDTVNVLSIHRKGKKHLLNKEIHETKKRELNELISVRKHEQFQKDGTTFIALAASKHKGLHTSCLYDPRVKRSKQKRGDRKPILDLDNKLELSGHHSADSCDVAVTTHLTQFKDTAVGNSAWRETCEHSLSGPVKHNHHLKSIFKNKVEGPTRLAPYQPRLVRCQQVKSVADFPFQTLSQDPSLRNDVLFDSLSSSCGDIPSTFSRKTESENASRLVLESAESALKQQPPKLYPCESFVYLHGSATIPPPPPPPPPSSLAVESSTCISATTSVLHRTVPTIKTLGLNEMSQKLRQLQGSGWKRDWDGKWIKDENAEFDSDEEAPDIP